MSSLHSEQMSQRVQVSNLEFENAACVKEIKNIRYAQ